MQLPSWVEDEIKRAEPIHTGHILIEFYQLGVTKIDILDRKLPPKPEVEKK